MKSESLLKLVLESLTDTKAADTLAIDVTGRCSFTDYMVICTGTSNRHVRTIAERVITDAKKAKQPPLGIEGESHAEWVLVDLGDVIVHIMLAAVREFYALEKLWQESAAETDETDTEA